MAGKHIGSDEHPPGLEEKRAALHTAILQWVAVLFYSTPFVLTHYIPLKFGKYFSSHALTSRWVLFLSVEKWRSPLCIRYCWSLHCRGPPDSLNFSKIQTDWRFTAWMLSQKIVSIRVPKGANQKIILTQFTPSASNQTLPVSMFPSEMGKALSIRKKSAEKRNPPAN